MLKLHWLLTALAWEVMQSHQSVFFSLKPLNRAISDMDLLHVYVYSSHWIEGQGQR